MEVSLVSVPAGNTVGVGRQFETVKGMNAMGTEQWTAEEKAANRAAADARAAEKERVENICRSVQMWQSESFPRQCLVGVETGQTSKARGTAWTQWTSVYSEFRRLRPFFYALMTADGEDPNERNEN